MGCKTQNGDNGKININIPLTTKELIKIRASQINQCAFCIDMHTASAIKNGETAKRLLLLDAWKETDIISGEEKAVLAIPEDITFIRHGGLSETTYTKAKNITTKPVSLS